MLERLVEWLELDEPCPACDGQRLNREALAVRFRDQSIARHDRAAGRRSARVLRGAEARRAARRRSRATSLAELALAPRFLEQVGLGYLSLDRARAHALRRRGAAHPARRAARLEPARRVLHPRRADHRPASARQPHPARHAATSSTPRATRWWWSSTTRTPSAAPQHVIDLGPGAGRRGGHVVARGHGRRADAQSRTRSPAASSRIRCGIRCSRARAGRRATRPRIEVLGAELHNLQGRRRALPAGAAPVVTGVSGSGKSTLARDVLHANLQRLVASARDRKARAGARRLQAIKGWEPVAACWRWTRRPSARRRAPAPPPTWASSTRSAGSSPTRQEARIRGYTASRFSFNTAGGRCDACEGQGMQDDRDELPARREGGLRGVRRRALQPGDAGGALRGKSIGEVLAMSVDEAVEFFAAHPSIHHALRLLQDVGLGYLTLGQQSPTLSGGEAQRIKLVTELAKVRGIERPGARGPRPRRAAHALRARRAHRGPAHGRRGEADPRAAPPGRCGQYGGPDRAQSRRDRRGRLDRGPGPRRRRRRRAGGAAAAAGGFPRGGGEDAHGEGAAGVLQGARPMSS